MLAGGEQVRASKVCTASLEEARSAELWSAECGTEDQKPLCFRFPFRDPKHRGSENASEKHRPPQKRRAMWRGLSARLLLALLRRDVEVRLIRAAFGHVELLVTQCIPLRRNRIELSAAHRSLVGRATLW
jgi:hypothetical protein